MSLPSPARGKGLAVSILSLSLLTVMAGAAVAPALGVIQAYFSGTSQTVVQLIISIPALFIVITNLCFPALSRRFSTKTLVLGGLLLYTVGGCAAGLFDQIALVLVMRALVGVGVGILMPLSTGLLTFYYPPERQAALMGYASAMNQMGGVIATLLAGLLSQLNWRASFLVYLLGLLSIVLCLGFLPSDRLDQPQHAEEASAAGSPFRTYFIYILAMFLLMSIFFVYPANFALETTAEGAVPAQCIAVIMAGADLVHLRRAMGRGCKLLAPVLFLLGFLLLTLLGGWPGTLLGSACIGFANGVGIPFLISEASMQAGKSAASTVMPLLSAAMYLAQFLSPLLLGALRGVLGDLSHLAYWFAVVLAVLFVLCSLRIPVGQGARRA